MPTDAVFLDSNGWVALLNKRDSLNVKADAVFLELGRARRPIVLTDWVLAETGNGLARTPARALFAEAAQKFLRSPQARVISISPVFMRRALTLYAERSDKTWGLVDCASFVVMAEHGITEAFTTDRHFEQAGFRCLLPMGGD
jgi:uncharacterized protein